MIPQNDNPGIVAYLMSLKSPPFNSPLGKGGHRGVDSPPDDRRISEPSEFLSESIAKGEKLVKDLGCTGCHEIEKLPSGQDAPDLDGIGNKRVDELAFGNIADIEKTLINWMEIKVMNPESFATDKIVTRMPNYDFSKDQTEALLTFLLSIKDKPVPRKYTKKLIDPDKAEMRGKKAFEKYNCFGCHKINKYGGDIGPDLTEEAKKSRPEWLFNFLKNPHKVRPLPISKESYPYNFDLKREIYPEDIRSGEKLYQEIFACNGCHTVNGLGGEVGPEHTDLASRLNRKWLEQWLKDPQAIKPDVRMPRYEFKGWEFEALTNYLMTLGKYRFVQPIKMD
jgi:cytochrome c2